MNNESEYERQKRVTAEGREALSQLLAKGTMYLFYGFCVLLVWNFFMPYFFELPSMNILVSTAIIYLIQYMRGYFKRDKNNLR